jgi:hypothetical protein
MEGSKKRMPRALLSLGSLDLQRWTRVGTMNRASRHGVPALAGEMFGNMERPNYLTACHSGTSCRLKPGLHTSGSWGVETAQIDMSRFVTLP